MEAEFRTGRYFGPGLHRALRSGVWATSTRPGLLRCAVIPGGRGGRREARFWETCLARELASSAASRGSVLAAEISSIGEFLAGRIRVCARRRSMQASGESAQRLGRLSISTTAWSWGRERPSSGSESGFGMAEIRAVATKRVWDARRRPIAPIPAASPSARRTDGIRAGIRNLPGERMRDEVRASEVSTEGWDTCRGNPFRMGGVLGEMVRGAGFEPATPCV